MEKKGFRGQRNENGRPKGSVNKATAETKEIIQAIVSQELSYLPLHLDSLKIKDRLEVLIKLLPFVMQKQVHIDLQAEITDRFTPVIIQMDNPKLIQDDPKTD